MAQINDLKRHLLREVVQENIGVRLASVPRPSQGRRLRRYGFPRVLLVVLTITFLTLPYDVSNLPGARSNLASLAARIPPILRSVWSPLLGSLASDPGISFPAPLPLDLSVLSLIHI